MSEAKTCKKCGKELENYYRVCPYCGSYQEISPKSGIACLLLLIFLGGFHRLYAGKIGSGIIFIAFSFTTGICIFVMEETVDNIILIIPTIFYLIWWIVDLISIAKGNFKDSKGRYIKIK